MKTQRGVHSQKPITWPRWHPSLRFPTSVNVRSGCLLFINHRVCAMLLQQLEETERVNPCQLCTATHLMLICRSLKEKGALCMTSTVFSTPSCVEKVPHKQSFWERSKECCDWHCSDCFILVSLGLDKCCGLFRKQRKGIISPSKA